MIDIVCKNGQNVNGDKISKQKHQQDNGTSSSCLRLFFDCVSRSMRLSESGRAPGFGDEGDAGGLRGDGFAAE